MEPNINFSQLIKELRDTGYSYTEIGAAVGRGESTVRNLARGLADMPRYDVGVKLVELHRQEFPFG